MFTGLSISQFIGGLPIPRTDLLERWIKDRDGNLVATIGLSSVSIFSYICNFSGTETLTLAHVTPAITVVSKIGTSTPTIGAGSISFSAGTMGYLLLSDGTELIFEGSPTRNQSKIYNIDGTGRHGTLVGDDAAPFSTANSDVSYLSRYGGSLDAPNGVELDAGISGSTGANQLIRLGNNTWRWVGDGSTLTFITFTGVSLGSQYRIVPTVLERISGGIKGNDAGDSDIFTKFTSTPSPKTATISTKIVFARGTGGEAIDITVQFSVQKIETGIIPTSKNDSTKDVVGNDISFSNYESEGFPGYANFEATADLIAADNLLSSPWMFTSGTPKNITPSDWLAFTGGSLENILFKGPRGLAVYSAIQNPTNAAKILRYLGESPDLVIGMFSDNHWDTDVTANTAWAISEFQSHGADAIITCGDNYEASLSGDWTTLGEMQSKIAAYEALFLGWSIRNKSCSTGNHTFPTYGDFDDFFAESTLVTKNSVRVFRDVTVINFFDVGAPNYTVDAETLTFLSDELEIARLRGNRVIIHTHVPLGSSTEILNVLDVRAVISTAVSNGVSILCILAGHNHFYAAESVSGVPHYTLDGLRELKVAYLFHITASGFTLETITG